MSKVYINMTICGLVSATALAAFMGQVEQEPPSGTAMGADDAPTPAPTPRTRKAKDEPVVETAKDTEVKGVDAKGDPVDEVPTKGDVLAAGKALSAKNGRDAVAELLGKYNATQISGLAEKDRAAFIAACEKAIA